MKGALTGLVVVLALLSQCDAIFCGRENCFKILGLKRDADMAAIKKAYRKLSLDLHPDRNEDPKAPQKFQKLTTAYEIVSNEAKRAEYEDFLDHPENYYWHYLGQMADEYGPPSDTKFVVLGILIVATALHYLNLHLNYQSGMKRAKESLAYKDQLAAMVKSGEASSLEDADAKMSLDVVGLHKPTWKDLLPVLLAKVPLKVGRYLYGQLRWGLYYRVLKKEMTYEDKVYKICSVFKLTDEEWDEIPDAEKEKMVERRVWEPEARDEYLFEKKIEQNRAGKGPRKRALKAKKKEKDYDYEFE